MQSTDSSLLRQEIAENARWLLHETSWGYLTSLSNQALLKKSDTQVGDINKPPTQGPLTDTFSFSDGAKSTGRIFFYVMGAFVCSRCVIQCAPFFCLLIDVYL